MWGREFKELGSPARRGPARISPPRGVKLRVARTLNYERIKAEFLAAVQTLPADKQAQIVGTLPEMMVAYALVRLGYMFQSQRAGDGGRLRLGGSVIDFLVYLGSAVTVIRVMGDYFHSLPERKQKDAVQLLRLRSKRYRVVDLWEAELYRAWVENRLLQFVEEGIKSAA